MTLAELKKSLTTSLPPKGLSIPLLALWHDARGDWEKAHVIAQDDEGSEAAWVHAYLHRKEGDHSNARYWYARAGRDTSGVSLDEEWKKITSSLLGG